MFGGKEQFGTSFSFTELWTNECIVIIAATFLINEININVPWINLTLFIYLFITTDTFINNSVDILLLTFPKVRIPRNIQNHWQIICNILWAIFCGLYHMLILFLIFSFRVSSSTAFINPLKIFPEIIFRTQHNVSRHTKP